MPALAQLHFIVIKGTIFLAEKWLTTTSSFQNDNCQAMLKHWITVLPACYQSSWKKITLIYAQFWMKCPSICRALIYQCRHYLLSFTICNNCKLTVTAENKNFESLWAKRSSNYWVSEMSWQTPSKGFSGINRIELNAS